MTQSRKKLTHIVVADEKNEKKKKFAIRKKNGKQRVSFNAMLILYGR